MFARVPIIISSTLSLGACVICIALSGDVVSVGPYTLELPSGWQRCAAEDEAETGAYAFHQVGVSSPIVVALSKEGKAFASESERTTHLRQLRDDLKARHKGLKTDKVKLAGVDVERHTYSDEGTTVFVLSPYNGERIFRITVVVPKTDAPFPTEVDRLLATLKLAGPPYRSPTRRGFLDSLLKEIDRLEQKVDEALGTLTGDQQKKNPPPDRGQTPPQDDKTKRSETPISADPVGSIGGAKTDTKVGAIGIAVDRFGATRATGLADGDRVWTPPVTQPVKKLDGPPMQLDASLDLRPLSGLLYGGSAATALAATRELMGPLSAQDAAKLDAKWAPYLRMPSKETEDYFQKLTPILQEVLALRTSAATAAAEFDSAWEEAVIAASYDSEEGVREALAIANQQRAILQSIQVRMADLAERTAKLGSPPNPIDRAVAARKNWSEALKTARSLVPAKPIAGAWVLKRIHRVDRPPAAEVAGIRLTTTMKDDEFRYLAVVSYTRQALSFSGEYLLHVRWAKPPALIEGGETVKLHFDFAHHRKGNDVEYLIDSRRSLGIMSDVFVAPDPRERSRRSTYHEKEVGFASGYALGIVPGTDESETGKSEIRFVAPAGKPGDVARLAFMGSVDAYKNDATQQAVAEYFRVYEYQWTTDAQAIAKAGEGVEKPSSDDGSDDEKDAIAFHQRNIRIIRANVDRDRQELEKETDPGRRAILEMRILQQESDIMAEEDLIASLETNRIVHRRTPFEDYAHDRFVQSIRENQVALEQFQRATAALQRLAGMLPSGEAEEARRFIDRQMEGGVLANHDIGAVRRMAEALGNKVQGYIEQERARAQLDEASAQYGLETAQHLKSAADKGMFVCSIFGGRGVMIAYQAATGYVEGGPQEAILRTASWVSTPTYIAAEAFRGYHRVDENGNPVGWRGAAADAAKAYVFAKLFEYGASKAKQWITGKGPDGLTAAERTQLAEFQRRRTAGELQAREFARLQADLERAGRQGASPQVITRLQNQVRRAAAAVHANPHAKNYLKYRGDPHAQRAYNAHMRANHAEVEARFHERMAQRGWNRQPLREFRNAASGDSVGMDHDIGLDESAGRALQRNGKPASLYEWQQDAQQAWDDAYREVTGQSAARSWETLTTSIHAESYRDLAWLSEDKAGIQKAWGQQAADVTRYKNWHMLHDPTLDPMTALQEVSRGTAKDITTKLMKLFSAAKPASPQSAAALARSQKHWQEVQQVLEAFGNNSMDPITASRRIRELTGKDIPQVVEDAAMMMESLARHVGQ